MAPWKARRVAQATQPLSGRGRVRGWRARRPDAAPAGWSRSDRRSPPRSPGSTPSCSSSGRSAARRAGTSPCSHPDARRVRRHLVARRRRRHPGPDRVPRPGLRAGRPAEGGSATPTTLEVRKAKALGVIAAHQAQLDLTHPHSTRADDSDEPPATPRPAAAEAARPGSTCTSPWPTSPPTAAARRRDPARRRRWRGSARPRSTRIKDWVGHSQVTIRPVLDLGRTDAVDGHDPPAWMRELVILRDGTASSPGARDARGLRPRPHRPLRPDGRGRTTGPDPPGEPRPAVPATSPLQDLRPLALPTTTRRHLPVARPPRPQLPRHPARHHPAPHQLTPNRPDHPAATG